MRLRPMLTAAFTLSLFAAVVTVAACSKDDDEEEKNATQTAATRASAATASKMMAASQSSASLRGKEFRAKLRTMYLQANAQARSFKALQADPGMTFDFCEALSGSCEQQLGQATDSFMEGASCETTSCENGQAMACTSASQTSTCNGVTYTLADSTSNSLMKCTNNDDGSSTIDMALDFGGSLSGGDITTPIKLVCKINVSMSFKFSMDDNDSGGEEENESELSCESGAFSCTIDGEPLSCADMKATIEQNACGE